ncbi:hypothetical protein PVAND_014023 [Polypedilum vanderplanki]|uniref:Adenylate kinase n=1 Tax=Polypedilum vanderplanki TaxID=319348 RepID=A0A9J6CR48_POLVA|nr:hypothetical protein PVAND_014023 [Polypedilum vanderplanki]
MSKLFRAVLLGAPGAGKKRIASQILECFNITHINIGDVLRNNVEKLSPLGVDIEKYVNKGALLPDDDMLKIVLKEINDIHGSFFLDGFPRTKTQAEKLWEVQKIDSVINLVVPKDVIIDDAKHRYVHEPSGRVYNIKENAMKTDITGEPLSKQDYDEPEVTEKWLKFYKEQTTPMIEFYKLKGIFNEFEGETTHEIWEKLKPFLSERVDKQK